MLIDLDSACRRAWCITLAALALLASANSVHAQLAPTIGYVFPSGGQAGTTTEVTLGGYDWTDDMQIFVHDPRIKLEVVGPPSRVLVPDPPYWFGAKARGPAWPLPREFKARLTIPAGVPAGLVRWQVANANGASAPGVFHVSTNPEVVEHATDHVAPQTLPELPLTVSGQIMKIEEVDRYAFQVPQSGPVTIELLARRLGSPLHAMLQVRDEQGTLLVDAADTEGRDLRVTFAARANVKYVLSLHDHDFAGDRSYIYRLHLLRGPQVLAAYPAAGRAGETKAIEFVGIGVATGAAQLESTIRQVTFPTDPQATALDFHLETPAGTAPACPLLITKLTELTEPVADSPMTLPQHPVAITGAIEQRFGTDRFTVTLKKDERWSVTAQNQAFGAPLDLELNITGPDGKQIATNDDLPGTTDARVAITAPADGEYSIAVSDHSGKSGSRAACYRLSIEPQQEDFAITFPTQFGIPLGGKFKLPIVAARSGEFRGPIQLNLAGLPVGVQAPTDVVIPADKNEISIELACAADAPASAALVRLAAAATLNQQAVNRDLGTILVATVMKPRVKITPEGLDDVRKVHRGSTYLAPLLIERLEGYQGDITLEMTSAQQRHRQGLACEEFVVPADAKRVEPPIFIPEWMETTKTSRMILNGVVKVADPRGNVRTLVNKMELRIGILPMGALMKLGHAPAEYVSGPGKTLSIPLTLSRATEFSEPATIELIPQPHQVGLITADSVTLTKQEKATSLVLHFASSQNICGDQSLLIRATALKDGRWPIISETTVTVDVRPSP